MAPKPYQKQLVDLLRHARLGIFAFCSYSIPSKVGGPDHAPLWEVKVSLLTASGGLFGGSGDLCVHTLWCFKAVRSTGSKAAAQEAAAKALLEDPELHEVLEDIRYMVRSGNPIPQLQADLSGTDDDAEQPSKRRRVTSDA